MTKELDYDQMEVTANKLLGLLEILNYLENTQVSELLVTANPKTQTEFTFYIEGEMLDTSLAGLQMQLKRGIKLLRPSLMKPAKKEGL